MPRRSKERKRKRDLYSKGELNRLIDSLLHPLFDHNPDLVIADTILHGLIEQNPTQTTIKFIQYNLSKLVKKQQLAQRRRPNVVV